MRYIESVQRAIELAEHYIAIGETEMWLFRSYDPDPVLDATLPWELVAMVKRGSMHEYETPVDLQFYAPHPCGLTFCWSYYVPKRDNSGPNINVEGMQESFSKLPKPIRREISLLLRENLKKIHDDAGKFLEIYREKMQRFTKTENFIEQLGSDND